MEIRPIAYIQTDFPEKFGVPRQSGLAKHLPGKIIFEKVPRNPTGKIEKPVLRKKYCQGSLVEAQIK